MPVPDIAIRGPPSPCRQARLHFCLRRSVTRLGRAALGLSTGHVEGAIDAFARYKIAAANEVPDAVTANRILSTWVALAGAKLDLVRQRIQQPGMVSDMA